MKLLKLITILGISLILASCQLAKLGGDAKKNPPDPRERVKRNLEEGKGFRLNNMVKKGGSGNFEFASSNELWRASLDTIDFIPLASVNYSGGIIITDWYSSDVNSNESIKITIRFLTNEIRSDALDINVFLKKCSQNLTNCSISKNNNALVADLNLNILKKASKYQKNMLEKRKKENPYPMGQMKSGKGRKKD